MANKISLDLGSPKEHEIIKTFEALELEDFENLSKELLDKALIKAASSGDVKTVETLLKLGADLNTQNDKKQTPLHLAFDRKDYAIVNLLLENGAQDFYGETPLHRACLHYACWGGSVKIVEILLQSNGDILKNIDSKDFNGYTPLQFAIEREHSEVVKLLLKNGCNTEVRGKPIWHDDWPDCTSFELALKMKSISILKMVVFHKN